MLYFRYHQIRKYFHTDDNVKYNDHDFPLGYKLTATGYLLLSGGIGELFGKSMETLTEKNEVCYLIFSYNCPDYLCSFLGGIICGELYRELISAI